MNNKVKLLIYGGLTTVLYLLLYLSANKILHLTAKGGFYFVIPVTVAFVFSYVHGMFTAVFWESLGLKARNQD